MWVSGARFRPQDPGGETPEMPPARGSLGKGPPSQASRGSKTERCPGMCPGLAQGFANTTTPTSHRPGPAPPLSQGFPVRLGIATSPHLDGVPMRSPLRNTRVCTPIICFLPEKAACAYFAW